MRYLFVVLLAGCAASPAYIYRVTLPIDYNVQPPADWPKLEERLTYADQPTVKRWCNRPDTKDLGGCSVVSFRYGLCMIYLSNREPALIEHERAHCAGYAHVGDGNKVQAAWDRWKANQKVELLTQ